MGTGEYITIISQNCASQCLLPREQEDGLMIIPTGFKNRFHHCSKTPYNDSLLVLELLSYKQIKETMQQSNAEQKEKSHN